MIKLVWTTGDALERDYIEQGMPSCVAGDIASYALKQAGKDPETVAAFYTEEAEEDTLESILKNHGFDILEV